MHCFAGTPVQPGIIPRCLDVLFNTIKDQHKPDLKIKPIEFNNVMKLDDRTWIVEQELKQRILKHSVEKLQVLSRFEPVCQCCILIRHLLFFNVTANGITF